MIKYLGRASLAVGAYVLPHVATAGLYWVERPWAGLAVAYANALVTTGLLLVFSVLPFPASPGTLRVNDFSGIPWLPHVAVTRLTNAALQRRARPRLRRRCLGVSIVIIGLNGGALAVLWARTGFSTLSAWLGIALLAYCIVLTSGFVSRELTAARRPLDVGTDIG